MPDLCVLIVAFLASDAFVANLLASFSCVAYDVYVKLRTFLLFDVLLLERFALSRTFRFQGFFSAT